MSGRFAKLLAFIFITLLFSTCKQDVPENYTDKDVSQLSENIEVQKTIEDIAYICVSRINGQIPDSATQKADTVNHIITIQFFSVHDNKGLVRNGNIFLTYGKAANDSGFLATINFQGFTEYNGYSPDSTSALTIKKGSNNSYLLKGSLHFTASSNKSISISAINYTVVAEANAQVPYYNIVFKIGAGGTMQGSSSEGISFNASVIQDLVFQPLCTLGNIPHPRFIQGQITYTPTGRTAGKIDLGNGDCASKATLSIGNFSSQENL